MGWSCRKEAGDTLKRWEAECIRQTGSQNTYKQNGRKYFYELERVEHEDGAITGDIFLLTRNLKGASYAGMFRIEGDGTVTVGPDLEGK